ncbi:1-phosphatidylinositol 3-phosphate 5-kinase isoform X2 [Aphidius gifuensis]|uniref:1-phosphatidylinositol 3-phosphate 5-kinase isoform X2 n=1 Tax=Aphidius gifuensis TaxID=684658 RepID=UPI001CDD645C|nr:1-phosphatidylinositol 3-phosphate 5-kinase isoform X2 [Aphidius gifuensis]
MMNKNVNSPTKMTEFAPLNSEENQPVVSSLFSKIFNFGKNTSNNNNPDCSTSSPKDDEQSSSGDSESWKQTDSREKTPDDDSSTSSLASTFPVGSNEGRSLPNVLKRISNIVASKSSNLKSYKDSQLRSYWMPDNVAKQCYECSERFTTFRRRHHCRVCGQIFCSKCCSDEIPGDLRVCTYCCKVVLSYLQSSDMRSVLSADLKALQEDLESKYGSEILPTAPINLSDISKDETRVYRKPSVGYMEEKYAIRRSSGGYLSSEERSMVLQNSASLRLICEELFRSCHPINLQTHRVRLKNYYNCFIGSELVNWLISQNKASTRIQATAIGQALFEGGFIESCLSESLFSDTNAIFKPVNLTKIQCPNYFDDTQSICDSQEPAWVTNIPQHDSTTDSESENAKHYHRLPSSGSSYYLSLNVQSSTVTLKRPLTSEDFATTFSHPLDNGIEQQQQQQPQRDTTNSHECQSKGSVSDELLNDSLQVEVKERNSWHKVNNLENSLGEMSAYNNLMIAYKQHEESLIKQLLNNEGLSQSWSEIILPLAHQIIDQVRPHQNHDVDDMMDIREYVQIKKSPGGNRNDCQIISGVVCSKNVAHRGMDAMIAHPKILLLQCGLMYQRVEGKLLSLEPVMLQENEYLGHTVARITALGPDVVLVHKSVSRLAQDRFRQCGVTLVLNVKLSVLERVARCTGGTIVNTIDAHLATRYKLGTCKKFYLRNFPNDKNGIKTFMYFENCANAHLGSTILLRGGTIAELKKVKKVTSTIIFSAYSWRLEKSFLMDEFAKPPSQSENTFLDETNQKTFTTTTNSNTQIDEKDNKKIITDVNINNKESIEENKNEFSNDTEVFKKVNEILHHDSDPYDTLKLFKSRGKSSIDYSNDSKSLDNKETLSADSNDDSAINNQLNLELVNETKQETKQKLREKTSSEEKRVHGKSVSDHSDPLHQYLIENETDVFRQISPTDQSLSVADLPLSNKFKNSLNDTILSFSPYLKFTIPYLETETGRNCILRRFFPSEIYYSAQFEEKKIEGTKYMNSVTIDQQTEKPMKKLINLKPRHPFTMAKLTSNVESKEVQALLANFRACGGRLAPTDNVLLEENEINQPNEIIKILDCLDSMYHQRLSVLFCSFAYNINNAPASFCVNPWIINMDLYGKNDIALGKFLERYCLTSDYKCPEASCNAQLSQHGRRFTHDGGCVQITLKEISNNPFGSEYIDQILMWSKCIECKNISPVVPMSSDTWSLSFAKYLELRFHGNIYTNRSSDNCQHSLHHNYYQYFSRKNMLAIFKYTKIKQLEISLPPPMININYDEKQHVNIIEEVKSIALKGDEVFTIIKEQVQTLQLDSDSLSSVKQQIIKEQMLFKNKIEEIHIKLTSPTTTSTTMENKKLHIQNSMIKIEDGLVNLKRLISDAVSSWNTRILEIAAKKKDDRPRKFTERSITSSIIDQDGYITEDTASESQMEDLSPMSTDNAIDAISIAAIQNDVHNDVLESSDNEISDIQNPADIIVIQGSPKFNHQRSYSDVMSINSDDQPDRRKKKKTLLSLLSSATTVTPITNPLGLLEHHLLSLSTDIPIVVYESEPSSIIAYALATHSYRQALQDIVQKNYKLIDNNNIACSSPLNKRKNHQDNCSNKDNTNDSVGELKKTLKLTFNKRGNSPSPMEIDNKSQNLTMTDGQTQSNQTAQDNDDDKKNIKQQNYIEVQFDDETTDFYCRIYFAAQFSALRDNVLTCGEDGFIRSLCRSVQWAARGGKSGSGFCKSRDDRFILKEMSRTELQIFLEFASNYFSYMEKCQKTKQPTLLGKIIGVYRVSFKNNTTNSALRTSVLVMENLFYNRIIKDKFDLKGSIRNRLVNPDDIDHEGELVLMDENLLNMSCDSPLYIRPHSKAVLNKAIDKDTEFLADNSVMDYSLLVGLEPKSGELVLGIIDYIRTFTWDKKLETMVKKTGILGGQGKQPTIVSPEEYRTRFISAMHRYFLPVPDRWTGLGRGVVSPDK